MSLMASSTAFKLIQLQLRILLERLKGTGKRRVGDGVRFTEFRPEFFVLWRGTKSSRDWHFIGMVWRLNGWVDFLPSGGGAR